MNLRGFSAEQPQFPSPVGPRRQTTLALVTLFASACAFLLTATPALARSTREYTGTSFGPDGTPATHFAQPASIAVDQTTHDVYVADPGVGSVYRFNEKGEPAPFSGTALDISANAITGISFANGRSESQIAVSESGELYVTNGRHALEAFQASGEPADFTAGPGAGTNEIGGFGELLGLAVDFHGDIYAGDYDSGVYGYAPSGEALASIATERPANLAVDSHGDVYVNHYSSSVEKFVPSAFPPSASTTYTSTGTVDPNQAYSVAVDPATGDLYVDERFRIVQYEEAGGEPIAVFARSGPGSISASEGVAVDASSGTVYVSDTAGERQIETFGPLVAIAEYPLDVTTEGPGTVTSTAPAEYTPIDCATVCEAEYAKDAEITLTAHPTERATFSGWSGACSGTEPTCEVEMTEARAVKAEFAAIPQEELTVATEGPGAGAVIGASPGPAFNSLDCGNGATMCAETYNKGAKITLTAEPAANYQFTGWSGGGCSGKGTCKVTLNVDTKVSADFVSQPPSIDGFSSSNLTATTAELHAEINPNGADTTYHFEYGTTTDYGASIPVPDEDIGAGLAVRNVKVNLSGLQERVVYHFRVVAENDEGEKTTTEDQTFNFFPPSCPNEHVRQQTGASYLPNCRAYELVSPSSQGNMTPFPAVGPATGYATGPSRLAYVGAFGDVAGIGEPSNSVGDLYVATRTSEGWVTKFIGLPGDQTYLMGSAPWTVSGRLFGPAQWQMGVIADPSLSRVVDWSDGYPSGGGNGNCPCLGGSNAPYVWESTTGDLIGRFPTNLPTISEGEEFSGQTFASGDLSHFVFSSNLVFAEGGIAGDTYDNNTITGVTTVISKGVNGEDKQGTTVKVSAEGSRILMAIEQLSSAEESLYMRVNDSVTYNVSENQITHELANVTYVGMTADGSKVFFTSEEHLTGEDPEHGGASLYMWNENGGRPTLTLISKGESEAPGAPGDSASCSASWTTRCGVLPISFSPYSQLLGGLGGNCGYVPTCEPSDSFIASGSGDIYFYSPEQLDGSKGAPNLQNLYVYRNGHVQYVTTLTPGSFCTSQNHGTFCSSSPVVRMDVTPNDSHMAFITASQVTSYDNDGHSEMYSYEPSTDQIKCVSCIPSGAPPTGNVFGSQNGLFLTNDGRTFFSTTDALVPQDTNGGEDVYEFTEGRPQLITSGTSPGNETFGFVGSETYPGLVGVSANGTDVYFSTFEVLVGQDQNGDNLKLYDARIDGGFPFVPPTPECAAADECHGAGSSPPTVPVDGTGANLGNGGNVAPLPGQTNHRHIKKRHRRRHGTRRHRGRSTTGGKAASQGRQR